MVTAPSMKNNLSGGLFCYCSPETSREAARIVVPYISAIQAIVLTAVRRAGEHGITDYELEQWLGNSSATLRSRRAELVEKGMVRDSGVRRKQNGSNRTVWVAA